MINCNPIFVSQENCRIFDIEVGTENVRDIVLSEISSALTIDNVNLNDKLILEYLYEGCPLDNVDNIYKIIKIINANTDHHMVWNIIYEQLLNEYEAYVKSEITPDDLIDLIKTCSIEASLDLILADTVQVSEDKNNITYCYEDKPLSEYIDFTNHDYSAIEYEIVNDEYRKVEVILSLAEAKKMYMAEHVYNYCGLFKMGFYNGKLQQYQYVQKATDNLSNTNQIKRALLNTLDKVESEFNIKNYDTSAIETTRIKLTKDGRNQQFEILLFLLVDAKVDYVIEDEKGNVFYPFVANIFYHALTSQKIVKEHKGWISAFQDLEYESSKLGHTLPVYKDKYIDYLQHVKCNQVWHYVLTLYAKQYKTTYQDMKKLVKFFKFKNQNNHSKSFLKPMEVMPSEIVDINKFSDEVI